MLALVTALGATGLDPDLEPLCVALRADGIEVEVASWDDPLVAWGRFDAIFLRSTWDYADRIVEFRAWLDAVAGQTRIVNSIGAVLWSIDKHYLAELGRDGVAVAPTTFVEVGERVPDLDPDVGVFVVKPAVGAGSNGARRCTPDHVSDHVAALHRQGHAAMVQPYLDMIDEESETALVYLGEGGELAYDHAFSKGAILTAAAKPVGQDDHFVTDEVIGDRTATDAERAVADAVLNSPSVRALGPLAYARIDLVPTPTGPVVLELELVEPSLYFHSSPGSDVRAARAWQRYLVATR
jgi:hypothetical protein